MRAKYTVVMPVPAEVDEAGAPDGPKPKEEPGAASGAPL